MLPRRHIVRKLGLASVLFAMVLHSAPSHAATAHVVRKGDTLWQIARAHGCSVDVLRRRNQMHADQPLRVGKRLAIPACGGTASGTELGQVRYTVARGDTLSSIATRYRTTVAEIQAGNGLATSMIRVGQTLVVRGHPPKIRVMKGQSIGRPARGKLVGAVQLPQDPAYYRRRPHLSFGATHVVDHVRWAISRVRVQFPNIHRLAVGDISAKRGGPIPGHRSHQSGRDIDLGLYFRRIPREYPREFASATKAPLHLAATWALVEALHDASQRQGGPVRIFLDYRVQGMLYRYAREQDIPKATLRQILQYPDGRSARGRLVRHHPNHADHLHVRFSCPPDDRGCRT